MQLWEHVDVLLGTEEELSHWTGGGQGEQLARACCRHGPKLVVVKRGAMGAAWATAHGGGEVKENEACSRALSRFWAGRDRDNRRKELSGSWRLLQRQAGAILQYAAVLF